MTEKARRHDVMAHVHTFGACAPLVLGSKQIIEKFIGIKKSKNTIDIRFVSYRNLKGIKSEGKH